MLTRENRVIYEEVTARVSVHAASYRRKLFHNTTSSYLPSALAVRLTAGNFKLVRRLPLCRRCRRSQVFGHVPVRARNVLAAYLQARPETRSAPHILGR